MQRFSDCKLFLGPRTKQYKPVENVVTHLLARNVQKLIRSVLRGASVRALIAQAVPTSSVALVMV
jgi:hypothetical protein